MPVTLSNKNVPLLHRKEWQMMTPVPSTTVAGSCVVAPDSGNFDDAFYFVGSAQGFLYSHNEDAYVLTPNMGLAGSFGAGSCGVRHPWSATYTANGGTTNSVQVASGTHKIGSFAVGAVIEFVSAGVNTGIRRTVTAINTGAVGGAGNITITFDGAALSTAIVSTNTFRLLTGRYFLMNAGTVAAGNFKVFDVATMSVSANLSVTNLPATWGTDGKLVLAYNYGEIFATGTATAGAASTLTNSAKNWTVNQWTNYQIRITAGTGLGQVRTIASNAANVITTTSVWTTIPDTTSVYAIEANEDFLYLLGNASSTMYQYSISANTWTVMAPTVARGGNAQSGMTGNAFGVTGDATWAAETNIQDGSYIYSLRGGGSNIIDRFDIAGGTSGAGAWLQLPSIASSETFSTGSAGFVMGKFLYLRRDSTHRFFKFDVTDNTLKPLTTNLYIEGTAVVGSKIWVKNMPGSTDIKWLYSVRNSATELHRIMLF
jgi:hypothetical protein